MRRVCIRGNNPGPLTRGGTNTWLLPGKEPTLIDAAEDSDEYAARVAEALEAEQPGAVLSGCSSRMRTAITWRESRRCGGAGRISCSRSCQATTDARCGVTFEPIEDEAVVPRRRQRAVGDSHAGPRARSCLLLRAERRGAVLRRSAGQRRHDHDSAVIMAAICGST